MWPVTQQVLPFVVVVFYLPEKNECPHTDQSTNLCHNYMHHSQSAETSWSVPQLMKGQRMGYPFKETLWRK